MTARAIAAEDDDYAAHVARVAEALKHSGELSLDGQWELDRDDLAQFMSEKGIKHRDKVHDAGCDWPVIPEEELACCGYVVTCLLNAAKDALKAARRRHKKLPTYATSAVFLGGASGDDGEPIHGEVTSAARRSGDDVADLVRVLRATEELSAVDRAIVLLHAREGLSFSAVADVVGIASSTVSDRFHAAHRRIQDLLGLNPS